MAILDDKINYGLPEADDPWRVAYEKMKNGEISPEIYDSLISAYIEQREKFGMPDMPNLKEDLDISLDENSPLNKYNVPHSKDQAIQDLLGEEETTEEESTSPLSTGFSVLSDVLGSSLSALGMDPSMASALGDFSYGEYTKSQEDLYKATEDYVETNKELMDKRQKILEKKPKANWLMLVAVALLPKRAAGPFLAGYYKGIKARYERETQRELAILENLEKKTKLELELAKTKAGLSKAKLDDHMTMLKFIEAAKKAKKEVAQIEMLPIVTDIRAELMEQVNKNPLKPLDITVDTLVERIKKENPNVSDYVATNAAVSIITDLTDARTKYAYTLFSKSLSGSSAGSAGSDKFKVTPLLNTSEVAKAKEGVEETWVTANVFDNTFDPYKVKKSANNATTALSQSNPAAVEYLKNFSKFFEVVRKEKPEAISQLMDAYLAEKLTGKSGIFETTFKKVLGTDSISNQVNHGRETYVSYTITPSNLKVAFDAYYKLNSIVFNDLQNKDPNFKNFVKTFRDNYITSTVALQTAPLTVSNYASKLLPYIKNAIPEFSNIDPDFNKFNTNEKLYLANTLFNSLSYLASTEDKEVYSLNFAGTLVGNYLATVYRLQNKKDLSVEQIEKLRTVMQDVFSKMFTDESTDLKEFAKLYANARTLSELSDSIAMHVKTRLAQLGASIYTASTNNPDIQNMNVEDLAPLFDAFAKLGYVNLYGLGTGTGNVDRNLVTQAFIIPKLLPSSIYSSMPKTEGGQFTVSNTTKEQPKVSNTNKNTYTANATTTNTNTSVKSTKGQQDVPELKLKTIDDFKAINSNKDKFKDVVKFTEYNLVAEIKNNEGLINKLRDAKKKGKDFYYNEIGKILTGIYNKKFGFNITPKLLNEDKELTQAFKLILQSTKDIVNSLISGNQNV